MIIPPDDVYRFGFIAGNATGRKLNLRDRASRVDGNGSLQVHECTYPPWSPWFKCVKPL
jgi:hypothetical protein